MVARLTDALSAYANAATRGVGPGLEARDSAPGAAFGEMVRELATDAIDAGRQGEQTSREALVDRADLTEVVMAVSNAEVSLQTVVAIRDKVIEAYQEIIRMPI
ncbi:MAG TPA: flagellar hook-basal body complex protein FliE [Alphaproteobacteria bacterium]|nr:flagellar hook-basal body complex protein FliE [Alphaproteobacteria bacterium]